jgi:hypothetical protein
MSLIRHAAQTHRGLGWCIYDHKFRCKAAVNPSMTWSMIDQQLWLMIFTTSPDMPVQHYPIFPNGPQNRASSAGERGGYCHNYNRWGYYTREPCRYRHVCNKCCTTNSHTREVNAPCSSPNPQMMKSQPQNVFPNPQSPNVSKVILLPTPVSVKNLEFIALSGHPDHNFVLQVCNNFKQGVCIAP